MDNSNIVVVKKKNKIWTVLGILLAIGAVCLVAAKLYQKFVKNKQTAKAELNEADELEALDCAEEAVAEEEAFEVPAEAVIANAEDMDEVAVD